MASIGESILYGLQESAITGDKIGDMIGGMEESIQRRGQQPKKLPFWKDFLRGMRKGLPATIGSLIGDKRLTKEEKEVGVGSPQMFLERGERLIRLWRMGSDIDDKTIQTFMDKLADYYEVPRLTIDEILEQGQRLADERFESLLESKIK